MKIIDNKDGLPIFADEHGKPVNNSEVVKQILADIDLPTPQARRQLARQLGVSPRTVEGWEQGRPINLWALLKLKADLSSAI